MDILPVDEFLRRAEKELPSESLRFYGLSCDCISSRIEDRLEHLKNSAVSVRARKAMNEHCEILIEAASKKGFAPDGPISPFQVVERVIK